MDTFNIIREAHKGFGYLILVAALVFIVALLMAMFGYSGKISKLLKKSTLFTMILFHLQFLIGIAMLVFFSRIKSSIRQRNINERFLQQSNFRRASFFYARGSYFIDHYQQIFKKERNLSTKSSFHGSSGIAIIWLRFPLG